MLGLKVALMLWLHFCHEQSRIDMGNNDDGQSRKTSLSKLCKAVTHQSRASY